MEEAEKKLAAIRDKIIIELCWVQELWLGDMNFDQEMFLDPFDQLPTMINDYTEGSLEDMLIKYRIANNIQEMPVDNDPLPIWFAELLKKSLNNPQYSYLFDDSDNTDSMSQRAATIRTIIPIVEILGDKELQELLTSWILY